MYSLLCLIKHNTQFCTPPSPTTMVDKETNNKCNRYIKISFFMNVMLKENNCR